MTAELEELHRAMTRLADLRGVKGQTTEVVEYVKSKGKWYVNVLFDGKPRTLNTHKGE